MNITKEKNMLSKAYGYDKEPIELRILFNYLLNLYKHTILKKDDFLNEASFEIDKGFQNILQN